MLSASLRKFARKVAPARAVLWRQAQYARKYGERELDLVPSLCDPSRDAIDVGANEGLYSNRMRAHARRTHAFEAVKGLADELRWKFGNSVTVYNLALSSRSGQGSLNIPILDGQIATGLSTLRQTGLGEGVAIKVQPVDLCRLDDVLLRDVGFIKIDVEGHEGAVLEGATGTIARSRPNLLIEAEERHCPGTLDFIRSFFSARGYTGVFVLHDRLRSFDEFDAVTMQNLRNLEIGIDIHRDRYSDYVNNFIFMPTEKADHTSQQMTAALEASR